MSGEKGVLRMKVTQAKHEANLAEHLRRSAAAEANMELLRQEFAPIKAHVAMWAGAWNVTARGM